MDPTAFTKFNPKLSVDLNIKHISVKPRENNIGGLGFGADF
jgi:hypothetical protein